MKTFIAALALLASAPSAHAALGMDHASLFLHCRDARLELVDAGVIVNLRNGGVTGMTFASVSETTLAGPQLVGKVVVSRQEMSMGFLRYTGETFIGKGFRLEIGVREPRLKNGYMPAYLYATVGGHSYDQEMACRNVNRPL